MRNSMSALEVMETMNTSYNAMIDEFKEVQNIKEPLLQGLDKLEKLNNIQASLDNITTRVDGLELGGNLVLRDVLEGEIFILDTITTPDTPTTPDETVSVQSITLNKNESTLNVDETEQLTVIFNPINATNQNVNWSSSDDTIATVVDGLVTAVASGNVTITATSEDGNKTASCSYTIQEVTVDNPIKMFLNGEGGSERYDSNDCLIWLDQSGNGKNYTFVQNSSFTNEKLIEYLWNEDTNIKLSSNVTSIGGTGQANNNTGLTSLNFTWDIKFKYNSTTQQVILGNGTASNNASNAFAITTNAGNILVRGNFDKIAIVNPLTTTMVQNEFYRITVTNDGSVCKLYLDGLFISSSNSTTFTSIASGILHTSQMDYSYIKYYDRALTETEIQGGVQ